MELEYFKSKLELTSSVNDFSDNVIFICEAEFIESNEAIHGIAILTNSVFIFSKLNVIKYLISYQEFKEFTIARNFNLYRDEFSYYSIILQIYESKILRLKCKSISEIEIVVNELF